MRQFYVELCQRVLEIASGEGEWKFLQDGMQAGLIPPLGNPQRLTTGFDSNALLYWLSGTWRSIEPKYHEERHLKYLVRMHRELHDSVLGYYSTRVTDIYPEVDFNRYAAEISVAISHSLLDFSIVNACTDTSIVLDYSAGYGRNLPMFKNNKNIKYIAADAIPATMASFACFNHGSFVQGLSPEVSLAKELSNFQPLYCRLADLEQLPDASICTVLLIWCFSEMDPESALNAVTRIDRLLKPGGNILVRDVIKPESHTVILAEELAKRNFTITYQCNDSRSFGTLQLFRKSQ